MGTPNEKMLDLVNKLVEINNDRMDGYKTAAQETEDTDLKALFNKFWEQSRKYKTELAEIVTRLGGKPTEKTSTSGKVYRAWMDIKAALTRKDRKAIVSSCEFGEDVALSGYKEALEDDDVTLSADIKMIIQRQKAEIKMAHDEVK